MGFICLGLDCSRFGSWFFFLLEWSEKPNAGHNPFETVTIFTFFFGMLL